MRAGQLTVGHPVDVASGTTSTSSVDLSVPGRVALTLEREFANPSAGDPVGPFGAGWSTRFQATLVRVGSLFRFELGSGTAAEFTAAEGDVERGAVVRDLAASAELALIAGEYVVTRWDVESFDIVRYRFAGAHASGRWLATAYDLGGPDALLLTYDDVGRLRRVEQQRERRALLFDYSAEGRVRRVLLVLPGGTA